MNWFISGKILKKCCTPYRNHKIEIVDKYAFLLWHISEALKPKSHKQELNYIKTDNFKIALGTPTGHSNPKTPENQ